MISQSSSELVSSMTGHPLFRMLAVVGRCFYRECTKPWFDQPFNCINIQTSTYCLYTEPRFDKPFNSINILPPHIVSALNHGLITGNHSMHSQYLETVSAQVLQLT